MWKRRGGGPRANLTVHSTKEASPLTDGVGRKTKRSSSKNKKRKFGKKMIGKKYGKTLQDFSWNWGNQNRSNNDTA